MPLKLAHTSQRPISTPVSTMASPDPDYSTQGYSDIIVTLEGSILTILINNAKKRNTLTKTLWTDLVRVFELSDKDDRVRVVILTAEPTAPAYCSGVDISGGWGSLWKAEEEKEGEHAHRDMGGQLSMAVYNNRKVTIAAVNGHAVGVGMTAMQLPFDIRFAWEGAKLAFPFVRRGIVPEATSSYLLPRLLGTSCANALILTGATVSPTSPLIRDLYYETLPSREAVYPAAKALAQDLAANTSQLAIAYAKGLVQHSGDSIEENHLHDSRAMRLLAGSPDGAEGALAFRERRLPKFSATLAKDISPWFPWWRRVDVRFRESKL